MMIDEVKIDDFLAASKRVADGFSLGKMSQEAAYVDRTAKEIERLCGSAREGDLAKAIPLVEEVVSATSSVKGLEDMCPDGVVFSDWYKTVKELKVAAEKLLQSIV